MLVHTQFGQQVQVYLGRSALVQVSPSRTGLLQHLAHSGKRLLVGLVPALLIVSRFIATIHIAKGHKPHIIGHAVSIIATKVIPCSIAQQRVSTSYNIHQQRFAATIRAANCQRLASLYCQIERLGQTIIGVTRHPVCYL